jgi:hypothetical protein
MLAAALIYYNLLPVGEKVRLPILIVLFCLPLGKSLCGTEVTSAASYRASQKWLLAGFHFSASFGELIPNPDPSEKRCIHK